MIGVGQLLHFFIRRYPFAVYITPGISLVSIANASENLQKEITDKFGWDFEAVVQNQKEKWNEILNRVTIITNDRREKVRFYTNMYRAFCRNTWSDVNGEWVSPDEKVQKLAHPDHLALGCDAFWNTFWNLNQLWNLITPEWSSKWVNSQLALYDANGWLAKGPAGMEYIPVMVAEHEIPLIVSAYQMGIRDFDTEKAFKAVKKMQTTPPAHVGGGLAGNRDLIPYLTYKYVPMEKGRFSNTLEYSYDDWTVGQFAKALGKYAEYDMFAQRGEWWKNAINPVNGYAHLRDTAGNFIPDFDPFQSGRNHHYVEGNAWQLTFFVPQDVPSLIRIIGEKTFVDRLNWGFEVSEQWRYNAPNDQYWDYPVVQGNQQSMHFAFLFNWANHPWLTQKWSRSVIDRYYGYGISNAYLGDEDQGQMSAWFVMAALGLFQTDGGCRMDPIFEIGSPLYQKVIINLGKQYNRGEHFIIEAKNASRKNKYIQNAVLNGKYLNSFFFPASDLLKGGKLILEMRDKPNTEWGYKDAQQLLK
jgi:predicted alpha-1,2-mannosidase